MFTRAVITDAISQDPRRVIQVCREYGVEGLELRTVFGKALHDLSDEEAVTIKQLADDHGMSIPCLAAPFFKCAIGDGQLYQEHIRNLRRYADLCHIWGCRIVRGMTFYRSGPPEDAWQQVVDAYAEPIRIAEEQDIYLAVENEPFTHIPTAACAVRLYEELNHPRLRATWDTGNEVYMGERPFPEAWERMKPWVIHIHIKDAIKHAETPGGALCVPIGESGLIDFAGQFHALVDMGYEGACSLETFWRPDEALAAELRKRPSWAEANDWELGIRVCLENINEIIASLGK